MSWWRKDAEPNPVPPTPLVPGECECGHARCYHTDGIGKCRVGYEPNTEENKTSEWILCACQVFIRDDDDDDDDDNNSPADPDVKELERMLKR